MTLIRKLQLNITMATTETEKENLFYNYLLDETNESSIKFIESIRALSLSAAKRMINIYADETEVSTVADIVKSKSAIIFEVNNEIYSIAGFENGLPKFKKGTSPELIDFPYSYDTVVKRLF